MSESRIDKHASPLAGTVAIASTYIYFLIFAQFAFLELVRAISPKPHTLDSVMAAMGISGLFASAVCARLLRKWSARTLLGVGFMICVLVSAASPSAETVISFAILAGLIGLALAFVTVSLASGLRQFIPVPKLGLFCGIGTGIAYFVCNVPAVFAASPQQQSFFASVVALVGLLCVFFPCAEREAEKTAVFALKCDYRAGGFAAVVAAFLALVWLDSAAFFVIQQTGALKSLTWGASHSLWTNALVHLGAAICAGRALDRGLFRSTLAAAYMFLAIGVLSLRGSASLLSLSAPAYCIGVSLYSTLLVAFPARYPESQPGTISMRWRAAWLYGVAGWIGSALGIGMAKDLNTVPTTFLIVAALGLTLSLAWHRLRMSSAKSALATGLLVIGCLMRPAAGLCQVDVADLNENSELSAEERSGRAVYIAEGCIHCHSQFVRPHTRDATMWGPVVPPEKVLSQKPPLIGNRRGGPDLLNVGNRRSSDWLRIHLIDPRATQPGSTMPSYAHLFQDSRGDNLVSYLRSLGRETIAQRQQEIQNWRPKTLPAVSREEARSLFEDACVQCHGINGEGDGPLASQLDNPPRNLTSLPSINDDRDRTSYSLYLARTIKFGIVGRSMPGHEYYEDEEILGLVEYVKSLANPKEPE